MKILLIEPAKAPLTIGGEDVFIYEPLALEYVAAGVSQDHDVRIVDLRLEKNIEEMFKEFSPDVVGITSYTVHVNTVKKLFEKIKRWNSRVLTVVGGHHATMVPEDFIFRFIDLIVMGEGVFTFKEIIARFERGEGFDGIAGVAMTKGDQLIKTLNPNTNNLDAFPFSDRRLTAKYRRDYYSEWMKPLASMRTSKGCPYRCKFCAQWKLADGRYLKREPERVVEELSSIEEPYVFLLMMNHWSIPKG